MSELKESLTNRGVVEMIPASSITSDIFNLLLDYLMYLKRKRTGKCKACGCADESATGIYHLQGIELAYCVYLYLVCCPVNLCY